MTIKINRKINKFKANATSEIVIDSQKLIGKNYIIYFYPKDNTPGCTQEGEDFRDLYKEFKKIKTEIFGVSRETLKSHEGFKEKFNYPFELISDPDEKLCKLFNVMKEKSMYGKKYIGIERSTFLIDREGRLSQEWRKVKVPGHANEVLEAAKEIK
ncbi:peroxiredoxin [SAR86 cluster bacterium]|nr:peroxiredoxin [SAR86 cluster bacterium]